MSELADDEVARIVADVRERRERGEAVDAEEVARRHPAVADALRRALRAMDLVDRAAAHRPDAQGLRPLPEDRYRDFRRAGAGGMGIVYWALDTDLNREVAFKVVRPGADDDAEASPLRLVPPGKDTPASRAFATLKARFLQEAWITGGLNHPGIVPVYELGETAEGVPYYTMRFVKGERTLADAIAAARDAGIDARLALLGPFLQVCDTIRYAHARGVVHRDLKPVNVALGEFGEVVVLDWGLAKVRGREGEAEERWQAHVRRFREGEGLRTVPGLVGTPGYLAPEAALGGPGETDERSDVYGLGAILYEILTGRLPFPASDLAELLDALRTKRPTPPREVDETVPRALSDLCVKALAREKAERPAGPGELADGVRRWQARREQERGIREAFSAVDTALALAAESSGAAALRATDRALAALDRASRLGASAERITPLRRRASEQRDAALRERDAAARRKGFRRAGAIALVLVAALAIAAASLLYDANLEEQRARRAEGVMTARAQDEAAAARASLAEAYAQFSRSLLAEGRADAARLAAARSLEVAESDAGWASWMAAEQVPAPSARWLDAPLLAKALRRRVERKGDDVTVWQMPDRVDPRALRVGGDRLWLAEGDGDVQVWDLAAGGPPHRWPGEDVRPAWTGSWHPVALSADGRRLYHGEGREVGLVDVEAGADVLGTLPGEAHALAVTPDGRHLVAGTAAGLTLLDARTGEGLGSLDATANDVYDLAFTVDGVTLVGASWGRGFLAWRVTPADGRITLSSVPAASAGESPGLRRLVVASPSDEAGVRAAAIAEHGAMTRVVVWDAGGSVRRFDRPGAEDLALDLAGRRLVVSSDAGLEVLDARDGRTLALIDDSRRAPFYPPRVAFDAAADRLFALVPSGEGAEALRPREWQWNTQPVGALTIDGPSFPSTYAFAVSADRRTVAWGADTPGMQGVRVWDAEAGRLVANLPVGFQAAALALSPTGDRVWVTGYQGQVAAWDVREGARRVETAAPEERAASVAVAGDALWLAWERAGTIEVRDAATLAVRETIRGPDGRLLRGFALLPGGRLVAVDARRVDLPGSAKGDPRYATTDGRFSVRSADGAWRPLAQDVDLIGSTMAVSPDGTLLASVGKRGVPVVVDAKGGVVSRGETRDPDGAFIVPQAIAFSPDGRFVLSTGRQTRLRVWEARTGRLVRDLPTPHRQSVPTVGFDAAGRLYTQGDDSVRAWRFDLLVADAAERVRRHEEASGLRLDGFRVVPRLLSPATPSERPPR